jgi:predicted GNAT family acetyltransferase
MYRQTALAKIAPPPTVTPVWSLEVTTELLKDESEAEVLEFLSRRPLHTVALTGAIKDNGLVSRLNRGTFYGCRNRSGELEGVALIGHATLMETRTDRALQAFAEIAQKCTTAHMIMEEAAGLRLATLDDLDLILPVHAQMAFEESGVNPLDYDPEGFRKRCARRIEQGRTWVWIEAGRLIFKCDIVSDTESVVYLEGIWTASENRGQGYGLRCMSQLARMLLDRTESICILVNEQNVAAHNFYKRAGYKFRSVYDTIFLQ